MGHKTVNLSDRRGMGMPFWQKIIWTLIAVLGVLFAFVVLVPEKFFSFMEGSFGNIYGDLFDEEAGRIDAADYLAFVFGVPLAALTSVVAVLIARATRGVATTQAKLQALDILDQKIAYLSDAYTTVYRGLEFAGQEMWRILDQIQPDADDAETISPTEETEGGKSRTEKSDQEKIVDAIDNMRMALSDAFNLKIAEPFWQAAINNEQALSGYYGVPAPAESHASAQSLYTVINQFKPDEVLFLLQSRSGSVQAEHLKRVQDYIPSSAGALERLGATLFLLDEDFDNFLVFEEYWGERIGTSEYEDVKEKGFLIFNAGAALIAHLLLGFPSRRALELTAMASFDLPPAEFEKVRFAGGDDTKLPPGEVRGSILSALPEPYSIATSFKYEVDHMLSEIANLVYFFDYEKSPEMGVFRISEHLPLSEDGKEEDERSFKLLPFSHSSRKPKVLNPKDLPRKQEVSSLKKSSINRLIKEDVSCPAVSMLHASRRYRAAGKGR